MESGTKELAVKENLAVLSATDMAAWGAKEVSANDLIIPQILVMQGLSEFVTDGKATMGEFRESLSGRLLGSYDKAPIEVVPFHCQEVWAIHKEKEDGNGFEYYATEPIVKSPMKSGYNDNLPWEDSMLINGKQTKIKRVRRYNFFVLLVSELEGSDAVMPYFISFKSTSVKEGKKLFNIMFVKNVANGLTPASYTFKIAGKKEKNDKGVFIIPTVEQGSPTPQAHLKVAFEWFKRINSGAAKLHEEGDNDNTAASSAATGEF